MQKSTNYNCILYPLNRIHQQKYFFALVKKTHDQKFKQQHYQCYVYCNHI